MAVSPEALTEAPEPRRSRKGWIWLVLILLMLLAGTYIAGRKFEPARARLAVIPLAGKLLFSPPAKPTTDEPSDEKQSPEEQAAADQATREAELAKRDAQLNKREADLKAKETALKEQETRLAQDRKATEMLKADLESRLKAEADQVEVVRVMKSTAAAQMFSNMSDDQVAQILRQMRPDEVARLLSALEARRSATLLGCIRQPGPCASP